MVDEPKKRIFVDLPDFDGEQGALTVLLLRHLLISALQEIRKLSGPEKFPQIREGFIQSVKNATPGGLAMEKELAVLRWVLGIVDVVE
jgi:hypothetical protein